MAIAEPRDDQRGLVTELDAFFAGDDIVAAMRPRMHAVSVDGATRLYQRRASCCRMYLLPGGSLCTSCPLVGDEERQKLFLATLSCAPGTSISAADP